MGYKVKVINLNFNHILISCNKKANDFYRAPSIQRNYDHKVPVNDVAIHPNQGELISCDQKGSIKIWDLGENSCTHELVCIFIYF